MQTRCVGVVYVIWWRRADIAFRKFGGYAKHHPVRLRHRVQTRGNCPQCICARHLPSTGGELLSADTMRWGGLRDLVAQKVLHNVTPFVRLQQTAVLFSNNPSWDC